MNRLRIALLPAFGLVCFSLVVRAAEPAGRVDGAAPAVDLGFWLEGMVLDPAGKTALVWGRKSMGALTMGRCGLPWSISIGPACWSARTGQARFTPPA